MRSRAVGTVTVGAVTAVLLLVAVQGCGTTSPDPAAPRPTSPSPASPSSHDIEVSLLVPTTTVKAGTVIRATLLVENRTGERIRSACGFKYDVGLGTAQRPFRPVFPRYCAFDQWIAVGSTRYPTTVPTTYQSCSPSGSTTGAVLGCMPGTYVLQFSVTGIPQDLLALGPSVAVTLN